jgi:hypothetical protein
MKMLIYIDPKVVQIQTSAVAPTKSVKERQPAVQRGKQDVEKHVVIAGKHAVGRIVVPRGTPVRAEIVWLRYVLHLN